jgi:hypothetical protein
MAKKALAGILEKGKAVSSNAGRRRLGDTKGGRHRHGGISSVSPLAQDLHPCRHRQWLRCGNHALSTD